MLATHSPIPVLRLFRGAPFLRLLGIICLFLITAASMSAQTPSISINDASMGEGDDPLTFNGAIFTISLSATSQQDVKVTATTQPGTASDNDFVGGSIVLTIPAGQISTTLTVFAKSDTIVEGNEQFFVNLSNPINATIADGQGVCTIIDDDALILLNQDNVNRGAAFDSVLFTRDPFPIQNDKNFSSDQRTRIIVFAIGLKLAQGETASAVTATGEDSVGTVRSLAVESVAKVPGFDWLTQVNLKLNDQITLTGDVKVKIILHAVSSNPVLVGMKPQ